MKLPRHPGESRDLVPPGSRLLHEVPAFAGMTVVENGMTLGGWVYIMTNRYNRVFYTGVTADLPARVFQHRNGEGSSFCKRYNLTKLVLAEEYPTIEEAIVREKRIKEWKRAWKIELIEKSNPEWRDLFDDIP